VKEDVRFVVKKDVKFALPRSGQTLYGQRTLAGVGTPTLCLHGFLDNCASFEPLLERLADLNLTAVDLPGHGLSDPIRSATCHYLDYLAVILELAHEQGWDRFHLVGHSFGGALATLVAGLHPEKVSRLVLIDSIGPLSASAEQARTTVARYLYAYLNGKGHPSYRTRDQAVKSRAQLADILTTTADTLVERDLSEVPGGYSWSHDPRLKYPMIRTFPEEQVLAYLQAITAPTLLITADRSALVEEYYPGRIAAVPDLRQVTLPGSHHLHMENAAPVAALVRQFLSENTLSENTDTARTRR
jgi:pimeloyl-ACP methyl ester carboxylesterase